VTSAQPLLDGRVVIVGAGVAGLSTALRLAPKPVVVLSKAPLAAEGSTIWAQGGVAAALGEDDGPAQHEADTLAAGDGLCDAKIVERFSRTAPASIRWLADQGARFDRDAEERLALGLEAAHSRRRIVHAQGDGTGLEIMRALVAAVRRTPSVEVLEGAEARRLIVDDGRIVGVFARCGDADLTIATDAVVIATGGVGGLFETSTNPLGSFGQGLALAARAGARLIDLEFVQFHPTALDVPASPAPLVSEAVRGEGAVLVDDLGERFMSDVPGRELAPRDVVARAIWRRRAEGRRVFLDARNCLGARFAKRFPAISAICEQWNVDPANGLIPVRPAQHYHMGGVQANAEGRTSVAGLWACGEVACTGLHGANRLASNSLSEALVFAAAVAESVAGAAGSRRPQKLRVAARPPADPRPVRPLLSAAAGVERSGEALRAGIAALAPLATSDGPAADPAAVALALCVAALHREESRGAHARSDFPDRAEPATRRSLSLDEALASARELHFNPFLRTA